MYADFDLVIPETLDEALEALAVEGAGGGNGGTQPLAGGTNMIVDLRARRVAPSRLVGLGRLDGLRGIRIADGRVRMGARTTMSDILRHPDLAGHAPSLVDQARVFGGQMVRNAATVAGNICSGSPAADAVPALLALDAEVTLASTSGTRVVPLSEFFLGYKRDARAPGEIMTEIAWDIPPAHSSNRFYKLALRKGDAITVVGVAVALAAEDGKCGTARIALGAVAPIVKRATAAEAMLCGQALTPELIDAAARQAVDDVDPIDDIRASAEYRRHCVHALTRRLVTQAWQALS
ncbi:MAG: FAD binding domain-containing protein [Proteobacteria bacterium]|nr:FAD binding domain-containing protein [Pseudomonadota bacterium]MCH9013066.1 FAD binding domain-containing protein [Pseudomonadota bacterium]